MPKLILHSFFQELILETKLFIDYNSMVVRYNFYYVWSHLTNWEKKPDVVWLYKFSQIIWMGFTIWNKIKEKSE